MIKIAQKFRPFSHTPGSICLIPGTDRVVEAFPTLIRIDGKEIPLSITGPVDGFTLEQDLERDLVRVFGKAKEGHFCHTFVSENKKTDFERLSFGIHKQLDWDLVGRRRDLLEVLPLLFVLGQKKNLPSVSEYYQTLEEFETLMMAGFRGILVPVSRDERYLGLALDEMVPMMRLKKAYESIRRLFIIETGEIYVLPNLLKPFHAGRMTGITLAHCKMDLEWTKRKVRRVHIEGMHDASLHFHWPKEIATFRIRKDVRERGIVVSSKDPIAIQAGKRYFLDKFEK